MGIAAAQSGPERTSSTRISDVPTSAEIRSVFLRVVSHALREIDASAHAAWIARFGSVPRDYSMMSVRDYLERVEAAAMTISSSLEIGIPRLHARAAGFLLTQPGATLFVTPRDHEPGRLLQRLETSRTLVASYGDWSFTREGPRQASVVVRDEYVWLDWMWTPVLSSIFPACGVEGRVDCELDGPYSGRLRMRW